MHRSAPPCLDTQVFTLLQPSTLDGRWDGGKARGVNPGAEGGGV